MRLYHGSDCVVSKPIYGGGKEDNDYGNGFYTTEDQTKAYEWAVANGKNSAYCNAYDLDISQMKVLHLDRYGVLTWISEIIAHRGVIDEETKYIAETLMQKYKINTDGYDVIIGYRADDSYTQIIDAFLKQQITADETERFFHKGNLGEQVFIKSQKAFDGLCFLGAKEVKNRQLYVDADAQARREVARFLNNRRRAIQIEGYVPQGLTIQTVVQTQYQYDAQYGIYQPETDDGHEWDSGYGWDDFDEIR